MDPLSFSMGQKYLFQICQKILSSSGFDDLDMPLIPTEAGQSSDTTVAAKTGPKCHAKILGMTRVSFCSWLYALVGLIWIGKNALYCSLYGLSDFTSTNKCFFVVSLNTGFDWPLPM